jgi:1A family penicillin-binding protein
MLLGRSFRQRKKGFFWRRFKLPSVKGLSLKRLSNINWGKWLFVSVLGGFLLMVAIFAWFSRDLPDPNGIARKDGFSTVLLDRTGSEELYNVFVDENRKFVPISDVPDYLKQATVAIEDKDFYKHNGFDLLGTLRGLSRLFTRGRAQGGSTLTQQMVKNVLLTDERSVVRKIKEFVLAVRIEKRFSKDEILQIYLNEAPYGGTAWGVEAAAQTYFGKDTKDLDLVECVILAGMPQAPSRYSPYGSNPLSYVQRATDVARRMKEDGYINEDQEKDVVGRLTTVQFKKSGSAIKAPHFVFYVKDQLEEMFGLDLVENGGLKVTTTLDWDLQQEAQDVVAEEIAKVDESLHITNGASVIMDTNNGEILSMVGSRDFFDENIDGEVNVTTRLRQPGSSIKPLVYAVALMKGFTPASVIMDVETEFPGKDENTPYKPKNYDGKEHGLLHLREALASSINIPAVKLLALLGIKDVLAQGYEMGIGSLEPTSENLSRLGLSMALGGGEIKLLNMTEAYSSFANGGMDVDPVSITKVEDRNGHVLYEHKPIEPRKVIDEKVAFLISSMLSDNNARLLTFGANSYLKLQEGAVAVKTGTTNSLKDNWTIGWTNDRIVGVWVGNNDNSSMKDVASGVSGASPIWRRQMLAVLDKTPAVVFEAPSGVEKVDVDRVSGYPAHDDFPSYKEWVIKGSLPLEEDPIHRNIEVCKGEPSKLASAGQIAAGNFDKREAIIIRESDPLTDKNLWQKGIDLWISKQTDDKYKLPNETCGDNTGVHVEIVTPKDRSRVDGNNIEVRFEVFSDKEIEWVDLYLDGNKEKRFEEKPYVKTFDGLSDGIHKIRVVGHNKDGVEGDRIHEFGVNVEWAEPTATQTPTPTATPSPNSTVTPTL